MAIGERIHFFRKMRGMTQKYLGMLMGFPERSADVRMAQYETGSRTPKADLTRALAAAFEVSSDALTVPDIDTKYWPYAHSLCLGRPTGADDWETGWGNLPAAGQVQRDHLPFHV